MLASSDMLKHIDLRLVEPAFGDPLTGSIVQLEELRRDWRGTTQIELFFDLTYIFQMMESLGSSRIEGNRTTVSDLIDTRVAGEPNREERLREIGNIEAAIKFVEATIRPGDAITNQHIREIHRITVDGLDPNMEGDRTPGEYRLGSVSISKSIHKPPSGPAVPQYMDELLTFIAEDGVPQFGLIRIAIAHHRFAWVHPFKNGNGRTVRVLTYAMLIQQGYNVTKGRINPTAVFAADRDMYYEKLAAADTGTDEGLLEWCEYVVGGWQREVERIERLADHKYLSENILIPAIKACTSRNELSDQEARVLTLAANKGLIAAKDVKRLMPEVTDVTVSRRLAKMRERKLLTESRQKRHHYRLLFANNDMMRSVIGTLRTEGFFSGLDDEDTPQ